MATDGPTPKECDFDIFVNGVPVFETHSIPSNAMEQWVRKVAEQSGQPVDWHFAGGHAVVKTTGTIWKVVETIEQLKPEHDEIKEKAIAKIMASIGRR